MLDRLGREQAVVPTLWWFELRNVLIVNERRGRISSSESSSFLRRVDRLPITVDANPVESDVLALARKHRLTVYDAVYLELARRMNVPLATIDSALARAGTAEGIGGLRRESGDAT